MGYEDVRDYHGGALEQGKDILMWKHDELRGRVNTAVVVKAERITGAVSLIGVIAAQVNQAFGSTFVDERTHETHSVHHVILLTSHEITNAGHEALRNSSIGARIDKSVTKIDGEKLWALLKRYVPPETVLASLAEATRALNEMDPDYGYEVTLGSNRVHLAASPKHEGAALTPLSIQTNFPDTPEGQEQALAFRRHIAGGQGAEIKAEYLTVKGLPEPLATLLQRSPDGTFVLGPRTSSAVFAATLLTEQATGVEGVLFPLIEFGTNHVGIDEMTLGNDQQPIPFKFHLTLRRTDKRCTFNFEFGGATNAASLLRLADFEVALAKSKALILEEFGTGKRFALSPACTDRIDRPGRGYCEALRKLVWIEKQLGMIIPLPEREFFTGDDVDDIRHVETILKTGRFLGRCSDVLLTLKPEGLRKILAEHTDGILGSMKYRQQYKHHLLGTEVLLGPVELTSKRVHIDPGQLPALRKMAEGAADDHPPIRLLPKERAFKANFIEWPKPPKGRSRERRRT